MTILEAIKAQVQYPLPTNFFESVLIKRDLTGDDTVTKEIMESANFKGAMVDCLRQLILYPSSISEGGMSISKADRDSLLSMANKLSREIGEELLDEKPKITFY